MDDILHSDIKTENNQPFINNVPLILDNRMLNRPPERSSNKSHNDSIMWQRNRNEVDVDESLSYKDTYIFNVAQISNESPGI